MSARSLLPAVTLQRKGSGAHHKRGQELLRAAPVLRELLK